MSEIKTIKGRVDFLCVPFYGDYERKRHLVTKYTHPDLDPNKTFDSFLLSEATEKQASLLVEGYGIMYKSYTKDYKGRLLVTAKESLFGLLKANGCWTKEMACSNINDLNKDDYTQIIENPILGVGVIPDDYLLIIKQ